MKAFIVCVSDLFSVNKTPVFLSKKLFEKGLDVVGISITDFDFYKLQFLIKIALDKSDIVFVIGGLDDIHKNISREAISEAIGVPLVFNENWLKFLKNKFPQINQDIKNTAKVPYNSKPIPNKYGYSLGFIKVLDDVQKAIVAIPDDLKQMEYMLEEVLKNLQLDTTRPVSIIRTFGLDINNIEDTLGDIDKYQIVSSLKGIDIFLWDSNYLFLENKTKVIKERLGVYVYAEQNIEMEEVVGKILKEKGLTISTAESSTGGLIASRVVNVSGSSKYFLGSIVVYSNQIKQSLLKVKEEDIKKYGAVSKSVAQQMAENIKSVLNSDIGISDTGIAGPTGGTKNKPVGLHYIGYSDKNKTIVEKVIFSGDRNEVRFKVSQYALNIVRLNNT